MLAGTLSVTINCLCSYVFMSLSKQAAYLRLPITFRNKLPREKKLMFPDYNLILSKQRVGKVTSKQDFGGRKVGSGEFSPSEIVPHLMLVVLSSYAARVKWPWLVLLLFGGLFALLIRRF